MKRNAVFSMLAVVSILFAITLTGCNKMTDKATSDQADSTAVKPTGKADPALKGTSWSASEKTISFDERDINMVYIDMRMELTYSVSGSTVSFDLTQYVQIRKSMTLDKYIKAKLAEGEARIAQLQKLYDAEQDATKKEEYRKELADVKVLHEENKQKFNDATYKAEQTASIEKAKQEAIALEPFATFTGTLNESKTELTIEKFPVWQGDTFKTAKVVFKK